MQDLLAKRQAQSRLRRLTISPRGTADFSSNDYLGLSKCSDLRTLFLQELAKDPLFPLGSGGSRLLDGNSIYAEQLEADIAAFHDAPAGLLFNSGFDANAGFFSSVPQPTDLIIYDEYIHASVHEGMRLSRAKLRVPFKHNSVDDLQKILEFQVAQDPAIEAGKRGVFIAVEAIYSMDGDVTPLAKIVDIVKKLFPRKNGFIIVDEAHSTGILGPRGRGLVSELGLGDQIFARLHTFGKALSCSGDTMPTPN